MADIESWRGLIMLPCRVCAWIKIDFYPSHSRHHAATCGMKMQKFICGNIKWRTHMFNVFFPLNFPRSHPDVISSSFYVCIRNWIAKIKYTQHNGTTPTWWKMNCNIREAEKNFTIISQLLIAHGRKRLISLFSR